MSVSRAAMVLAAAAALASFVPVTGAGEPPKPPTGTSAVPTSSFPPRAEVARTFACPAGTERMGATPPEGFETWCEKVDEFPPHRRHGPAFRWYDDGNLAQASAFVRGALEGRFLEWHRNGKLARAGTYRANARVGTWTVWFESGRREEECSYDAGARHGAFATWWPDGKRRVEGRYCHDLQCGTWTTWDDQGRELGKVTYEEVRRTP